MSKNKEKTNNFCKNVCKTIEELTLKKQPCKCIFEIYIDGQGEINKNPAIIIQSKIEI